MEAVVGRIIEHLAAVFRRSLGDGQPAASAAVAPRPAALAVTDGYVVAHGTRFVLVARVMDFAVAVIGERRIALRLPNTEYSNVRRQL
jgi:stage V sporulation protein SpoVS